jgi:GH15 family glucan-1,4-alpha-glucosidase
MRTTTTRPFQLRAIAVVSMACIFAGCNATEDNAESAEDDVIWDPISTALGNSPNFAQLSNGSLMTVVSREFGRGSKAGSLVEFFYPQYAKDNLWDAYVGVRQNGAKFSWSHQLRLEGQRVLDGSSVVQTDLRKDNLRLRIEDIVPQGTNAHLRRVTVENTGGETARDVQLAFYAFFTVDNLPGGDRIRYDATNDAFVQSDNGTSVAWLSEQPSLAVHCGNALQLLGNETDARIAVQRRALKGCPKEIKAGVGGVNGASTQSVGDLAPGAKITVSYAMGAGSSDTEALIAAKAALGRGFAEEETRDRAHWSTQLARAVKPALPPRHQRVYERALITILQHRVDNGAFIAAPTLTSPVYRFVWPRDGSKTAVDLLDAGYTKEAETFFEFLEKLQLPDGSFAVNYYSDGSKPLFNFGTDGNENDQPGMLPWGVNRVFQKTNSRAWAAARLPAVKRSADHLLAITDGPDHIVAPSRDLWELETGSSWTYAQGTAIAGLESAATLATALGDSRSAASYNARAAEMRSALIGKLVTSAGYFARGIKNGKLDARVEIANLALGAGGFGLLPDTAPSLKLLGVEVRTRLMTPGGAVRRYEGDRYYGGQPWPVAAVWVATHELALGNRAKAETLFNMITDQAYATESLMIGEQFEESTQRWLSSQPLVWSEAAYTRLARKLYGM